MDDESGIAPVYNGGISISRHGFSYHLKPHAVLTTSDIPPQARGCNLPTLHVLLPLVSEKLVGKKLPPELVELIIDLGDNKEYPARGGALGISWKIAEQMRREVMDDRRANNKNVCFYYWLSPSHSFNNIQQGWESINDYSLCEH